MAAIRQRRGAPDADAWDAAARFVLDEARDGVDGIDGLAGASSVSVSGDGLRVSVSGASDDALAVFRRNLSDGRLVLRDVFVDGVDGVDGLASALGVADGGDGQNVYVAGAVDDALASFTAILFADGFESGDTSAWSVTVP